MSNMPYCRFENTLHDLRDCYDHLSDPDLSKSEERCRKDLIELCGLIYTDAEEMMEDKTDEMDFGPDEEET